MNTNNIQTENITNQNLQEQAPQKAGLKNKKEPTKAWLEVQQYRDTVNADNDCIIADDYSCVVYLYMNKAGKPCVRGYIGRSKKPRLNVYYSSVEIRDERVNEWMQSIKESNTRTIERAERLLQVGDVLVASWGYEQTNVNYYLVTNLVGKRSLELIKIGAIATREHDMSGHCVPDINDRVGEPFTKQVSKYDGKTVKIDCGGYARKLNFKIVEGHKIYDSNYYSSYH